MKTILTCLISCFVCLSVFADVMAQPVTIEVEQGDATLGVTVEERNYIQSVVDYTSKKSPKFAIELVSQIKEAARASNKLQANNTTLSQDDIDWVTKHAKYWGHRRGYERTHTKHAVAMLKMPVAEEASLSATPETDANKKAADKEWDSNGIWNDLWWFYGYGKWEPMKSEIQDIFSKEWDRGYIEK